MANAYECDRCGKLYKEYDTFAPEYQLKKHGIKIMSYEEITDGWPKALDLCPICMKEIINALERKDKSIEVETKEESEEALSKKVKSIGETLEAIGYVTDPFNKDKIDREMELYPCKKCIYHNNDNDNCNIGVGLKCLREPEKYWKAKED